MKILVADDEFYARKAIVQMVLDWDPSVTVLEAEDGFAAMESMANNELDLLLTDIRMPGADGIQLAAHLYHQNAGTMVAIISGFDDFPYAQEAIRYKVEDYLLKPMDRYELFHLLDRLKAKADDLRRAKQERALASCLYGHRLGEDMMDLQEFPNDVLSFQIMIVQVKSDHREAAKQSIQSTITAFGQTSIIMHDNRFPFRLVIWLGYKQDKTNDVGYLRKVYEAVLHSLIAYMDGGIKLSGISSIYSDMKKLSASFDEAKYHLLQNLITGNEDMRSLAPIRSDFMYHPASIFEWSDAFRRQLSKGQYPYAKNMLEEWMREATSQAYSAAMMQDWFNVATKAINEAIDRTCRDPEANFYWKPRTLYDYLSIDEAYADLIQLLDELERSSGNNHSQLGIVKEIQDYVQTHYKDDIHLEHLAREVYFVDPGYLSRLFKKRTGMGFSQYVLSIRMHKARHLLRHEGNLSIAEIAGEVGYNESSYFIQMYKRHYGETPGQYRNQLESSRE